MGVVLVRAIPPFTVLLNMNNFTRIFYNRHKNKPPREIIIDDKNAYIRTCKR